MLTFQDLVELLKKCYERLDFFYANGTMIGPDADLAKEIQAAMHESVLYRTRSKPDWGKDENC